MIRATVERMYTESEENRFLEVTYANGDKEVLYFKDFNSGAMIQNIVDRAKKMAIKDLLEHQQRGIRVSHLLQACVDEVAPTVADRSIELRLDLSQSVPRWVQGDAARTRQLIVRMLQGIARHASFGPIDIAGGADEQLHLSVLGQIGRAHV